MTPFIVKYYEDYRLRISKWDGNYNSNSDLATLFETFLTNLGTIAGQDVPNTQNRNYIFNALLSKQGITCTQFGMSCSDYAKNIFMNTIDSLNKNYLKIPNWGDIHYTLFPNLLFTTTPFNCLGDSIIHSIGGTDTVNVAPLRDTNNPNSLDYITNFGPTYRQIIDINNLENSLFINTPGQSGNLLSIHYDDLMPLWASGQYTNMKTFGYFNESFQILLNIKP